MDFLLKQRLIGAVVLVALGVIFIPMLLEENVRPEVPEIKAIPEPEALPKYQVENKLTVSNGKLPLPPVSVITKQTLNVEKAPVAEKAHVVKKPLPPIKKAIPKPEKKKAPVKPKVNKVTKSGAAAKSPDVLKSWVVQAGSFTSRSNAFSLRDKLRKSGFTTQVDRVVLASGVTFRVRVGPYTQKSTAEKAMAGIGKKFKLKPKILQYP